MTAKPIDQHLVLLWQSDVTFRLTHAPQPLFITAITQYSTYNTGLSGFILKKNKKNNRVLRIIHGFDGVRARVGAEYNM